MTRLAALLLALALMAGCQPYLDQQLQPLYRVAR